MFISRKRHERELREAVDRMVGVAYNIGLKTGQVERSNRMFFETHCPYFVNSPDPEIEEFERMWNNDS